MINRDDVKSGFYRISHKMEENKAYLISLDQQNGDGDLGISMSEGFSAVVKAIDQTDEKDLGRLMMMASRSFNEAAPSSLGTILAFGMMGMAQYLRGKETASISELSAAMENGLKKIMEKAGSKPGEKTVLDALCPAVEALSASEQETEALKMAAHAAEIGSESTRQMRAVHGRAAYYGEKSIGILDGGSVAGRLIFEALAEE